jgi:hypothetical protein
VVRYLLGDLYFHVNDIFLVDDGFVLLSLKLLRNFLQLLVISSCFMLVLSKNPWRSIRECNLHKFHLNCYWISHFQRFLGGV